jgi:hypothetical protein
MIKLLSVLTLVTICFATEAAAQVYVPAPIQVPVPVNSSHILISREIGRIAVKRMQRRTVRRRRSGAKSPATRRKVSVIDAPLQSRQERSLLAVSSSVRTTVRPVAAGLTRQLKAVADVIGVRLNS